MLINFDYIQGNKLPFHMYTSPYETANQCTEATLALQREYKYELAENETTSLM